MNAITKSTKQTRELAADFAKSINKYKTLRHAQVVALEGELGAGKTTFVQGVATAFKIKNKITSPTFVILKQYPIFSRSPFKLFIHIDAYRLKNYRDLIPLGIKELTANPQNVVLIEWSDRVKKILPAQHARVHIDHIGKNKRRIVIVKLGASLGI